MEEINDKIGKGEISRKELEKRGYFKENKNELIEEIVENLGEEIPEQMRVGIALYTLMSFIGHFQFSLKIEEKNLVPINVIITILAHSGAKKTSSVAKAERMLKDGYQRLDEEREYIRLQKAKKAGLRLSDIPKPMPLINIISTVEGMVVRLNSAKREGLGVPSLFVDELVTALEVNRDELLKNIEMIAQLFDSGDLKVKIIKEKERQSEEVKGVGMSALFIGTGHVLLNDLTLLEDFRKYMASMMARRSLFIFPEFKEEEEECKDFRQLIKQEEKKRQRDKINIESTSKKSDKIAKFLLKQELKEVTMSEQTKDMVQAYTFSLKKDSREEGLLEEEVLETKHRHWKALKIAAMLALIDKKKEIEEKHFKQAVYYVELLTGGISKFIRRADSMSFEKLVIELREIGKPIKTSEILKRKWVKRHKDIEELIILANSSITNNDIVVLKDEVIKLESPEPVDSYRVSWVPTRNLLKYAKEKYIENMGGKKKFKKKEEEISLEEKVLMKKKAMREAKSIASLSDTMEGFKYQEATFKELASLLDKDCSFCPFEYVDGSRREEEQEVLGKASFVVLDIDDSNLSMDFASDILKDYTHAISTTSNPDNEFKFRVILALDIYVDLDGYQWRVFQTKIGEFLGLNVDQIAKKTSFFGYSGGRTIIEEGQKKFPASIILKDIKKEEMMGVEEIDKSKEAPKTEKELWKRREIIFKYAYEARRNSGDDYHSKMFRMMRHAHRFGASYETNIKLYEDIVKKSGCEPRKDWKATIKGQRRRVYGK